jgi:hypothetical protein
MSDSTPDEQPKPQPKFGEGPPRPPKKTARDSLGGSGDLPDFEYAPDRLEVRMQSVVSHAHFNLGELLCGPKAARPRVRESLETNLDEDVVLLGEHIGKLVGDDQKLAADCLRLIRDYRRDHPRSGATDSKQAEQAQKILEGLC